MEKWTTPPLKCSEGSLGNRVNPRLFKLSVAVETAKAQGVEAQIGQKRQEQPNDQDYREFFLGKILLYAQMDISGIAQPGN